MKKPIGHFHVITDEAIQNRFSHARLAEMAIAGGADFIQLRDKHRSTGELVAAASEVQAVCRAAGIPLVINDRLDVALAVGADGVHLGRMDLPIAAARGLLGPQAIIGGTASDLEQARQVERDGADYIGFGHIYPTASKNKNEAARGTAPLAQVCRVLDIPVVAIGGIEESNVAPVLDGGAWGVAVIAAVCAADDPERAAAGVAEIIRTRRKRE
jgi:thiamine-phosphate pyrophosphorylase